MKTTASHRIQSFLWLRRVALYDIDEWCAFLIIIDQMFLSLMGFTILFVLLFVVLFVTPQLFDILLPIVAFDK